jgi:polyhydroxyalkanoate synthesis regulator phasin
MNEFDEWWEELTENSDEWSSFERMAAKQAWETQQEKIDALKEQILFLENPMAL